MYRNSEGYRAPTEGYAIAQVMREYKQKQKQERMRVEEIKSRSKVYVVSKYAGDIKENVLWARRYCRFVVKNKYIPIASHLFFPRFLNDDNPKERELGLLFGQSLLQHCAQVWVFGTEYSDGMKAEIHEAIRLNKTIRYFNKGMVELYENDRCST